MLGKILRFFTGRVRIYADAENSDALTAFLTERKIDCKIVPDSEKGGVYTDISPYLLKNLALALDKSGIIVYIINIYGFAHILSRYRARAGLAVGAVIFMLILWASTLFVWKVELEGSEMLSKEQLRAELEAMGVYPGCRISEIDKSTVANRFLSLHPELSWAGLNFNGTTVSLTVKETLERPDEKDPDAPLLVAKHDGVVSFVGVYEGCAVVNVGTVVKKGDVLISGFVSGSGLQITDTPLLRTGNAKGVVKAEVAGKIEMHTEFSESSEIQTLGKICGRSISVFGHDFDIGRTDGESDGGKNITVFGFIELPITVKSYREVHTKTEVSEYDRAQAEECAKQRAYQKLNEKFPSGEVLKIRWEVKDDDTGVTVFLSYVCETDICEKMHVGK